MNRFHFTKLREERGVALLIAVIMLLLISAIGIAALQHAREESTGGGRSRHHTRNLHAADGVLALVVQQRPDVREVFLSELGLFPVPQTNNRG